MARQKIMTVVRAGVKTTITARGEWRFPGARRSILAGAYSPQIVQGFLLPYSEYITAREGALSVIPITPFLHERSGSPVFGRRSVMGVYGRQFHG